jgi:hypothetical protein
MSSADLSRMSAPSRDSSVRKYSSRTMDSSSAWGSDGRRRGIAPSKVDSGNTDSIRPCNRSTIRVIEGRLDRQLGSRGVVQIPPSLDQQGVLLAKLKAFLRAARPRTFDEVTALVATALALFTPTECRNYIRHCGYRLAVQL